MSARISLQTRVDDYLAERRRLGYQLHSQDTLLASFARYVASRHHRGPLTVELMADWARQDKWNRGTPGTWAVRLALLRHFARYLKQFEPDTEVPDELIFGVKVGEVVLDEGAACVHLHGKGRKQRSVPLWRSTVKAIRAWVRLNPQFDAPSPLLPNRDGHAMTRSNVTKRLVLAVQAAARTNPSLATRHVSPHTFRHTTAMHLLQAGVDISVIALWLGHESPATTHHYVEADLAMKDRALARLQEPDVKILRYRPPDSLINFLKTL